MIDRVDLLSASHEDLRQVGITGAEPYREAIGELGLQGVLGAAKAISGRTAQIEVTANTAESSHKLVVTADVVDPVGAGDAAFGTFLACLDRMPLAECVERVAGAIVTSIGLFGDALTADPWDHSVDGAVRR